MSPHFPIRKGDVDLKSENSASHAQATQLDHPNTMLSLKITIKIFKVSFALVFLKLLKIKFL